MDLWTAILTIIRRWYISLPVLVLGIIATIAVGTRLQPEYQANASVIFVPPTPPMVDGIRQDFSNPLMIAGGVEPATEAVYRKLTSTSLTKQFESFGYSEEYQVFAKERSGIIDFVVIGNSEQQALLTTNALISEANNSLLDIQTKMDADPDERITVKVIDLPTEAEEQSGNLVRVIATVSALSLAAAAASAILTESIIRRRRQDTISAAPNLGYPVPGQPPVITSLPDGTTTVSYLGAPPTHAIPQVAERSNGKVAATEAQELDRLLDDTEPATTAPDELTTQRAEPTVVNAGRKRFSRPRSSDENDESADDEPIGSDEAPGGAYAADSVAPNGAAADAKLAGTSRSTSNSAAAAAKATSAKPATSAKTSPAKPAATAKATSAKPATSAKTSAAKPATSAKATSAKPATSAKTSAAKPATSAKTSSTKATPDTKVPPSGATGAGTARSTKNPKSAVSEKSGGSKGSSDRARP